MSPFAKDIVLPKLRTVNRQVGAVCAAHLVAWMDVPVAERTLRNHLRALEAAGLVARPFGPRSGWMVVQSREIH